MATVNLGAIKFNWKGAFNNSTAYAVDDVVSSSGNSYVCILASTGNAVSNGTYWNLMAQAGTNGTDGTNLATTLTTRGDLVFRNASTLARLAKGTAGQVLGQGANDPAWVNGSSSTLTTQGDILYRDGSGLQRLAKGTAGQVLKMNSAANAPEYGDGGGYWVVKAKGAITGSTTVNFIFGASQKVYKLIVIGRMSNPKIQVSDDGGSSWYSSAGNYKFIGTAHPTNNANATVINNANADNFLDIAGYFAYAQNGGYLEVNFANMGRGGDKTSVRAFSSGDSGGNVNIGSLASTTTSTAAMTAFRLITNNASTNVFYSFLEGAVQ